MKVLQVVHYPVHGGPPNQTLRLARPLAEAGWETVVALPEGPGNAAGMLRGAGIPVEQIPLHRLRATADLRAHVALARGFRSDVARIGELIDRLGVDLVLLPGIENAQAAFAARSARVPLVWQLLSTRPYAAQRRLMMPLVARLADVVMTTGETIAAAHPGVNRLGDRWVPFFPPVDLDLFAPRPGLRAPMRRELGLADRDVVIGTVGNINPQKGHRTLLRAAAHARGRDPRLRFVVLGERHATHGGYFEGLLREAAALELEVGRDVIFHSPGARVAELLSAFDVFWLTSDPRSEGVPTVILEAMAAAIPVVATDVGGVRDAVDDGRTGLLAPPRGVQELATAVLRLAADPELRRSLGEAGRHEAERRFGLAQSRDSHLRAFEIAAAGRR